jgi:hypothetical protein
MIRRPENRMALKMVCAALAFTPFELMVMKWELLQHN